MCALQSLFFQFYFLLLKLIYLLIYLFLILLQVDAKLNVISSCNYDGSDRRMILYSADTLRHPFSITTFEDWIYWTDWDKMAVFKANKFDGHDVQPITATQMVRRMNILFIFLRIY